MPSAAAAPPLRSATHATEIIADRYRVVGVLGRGGIGEVLEVIDVSTERRLALKRLLPGFKSKHVVLLSREFHTLVSIRHPHVVQVFDYGTCDGVPYYTMERLEGTDVEALAPLRFDEVVPLLRDVASVLSLLHARHLVHRDVSARNVWRTSEGVNKLIDFGALASFGEASDVAGTPPYLAPEALRSRVLDQRTDLYALGALGYFLLTGRHAYSARSLRELESHWAEEYLPLSSRVKALGRDDLPEVPERLEQLIEALLSCEPNSRPSGAAEVLDRLEAIVPAAAPVTVAAVEGTLANPAFAGRESERKRLGSLLKRANTRAGASVALLGPQGSGRSRLLAELAVEARISGATAITVTGDGEAAALSSAARAALKLIEALPSVARECAAPHAAVLGHLSPEVREALGVEQAALESFPETAGEARMRVQVALFELWLAVAQRKPLLLLLDDLQSMDEASAALFASLSRAAGDVHLLVVASVRTDEDRTVPRLAQAFVEKSVVLALSPLPPAACTDVLRSLFGDVEHLSRTSQRLSEWAEGNPGRLVALCEYLVRNEVIRYADGAWILPHELSPLSVPPSFEALAKARLARVSAEARRLARALSVVQGHLSLEHCSALSPLPMEQLFDALSELCALGIMVGSDQGYRFARGGLRVQLNAELDDSEKRRAHRAAGEALLAEETLSPLVRLTAGVHLLHSGLLKRGAEVVHQAACEAVVQMPEERLQLALQLEQAMGFLRQLDLSPHERLSTLSVLAWSGYFADRRFGYTYGDEALACAQRVCGMDLARRLSPWLGHRLGLYVALAAAAISLRRRARKSALVPSFALALRFLVLTAGSLSGMYALCAARDKVLAATQALEPLRALGDDHIASIVYRFGMGCVGTVSDRMGETRRHWEQLMARLDDPKPIKGLTGNTRTYYAAASMYGWGATECWRDKSRALEIADRLERQPLKLYQLSADQLRAIYYAQQGNMREAKRYRARVETRALQRGMTWQVEVWEPSSAVSIGVRQYDAMTVKRAAGQLSHLSEGTPTLRLHMEGARASYLLLRGRFAEARELFERTLRARDPLGVGYVNNVGLLAQAHNGLGEHAEAEALCSRTLAALSPEDLAFPAMTLRLQIELCLAQAGVGAHEKAAARLDALIAQHATNEGALTLGALHEARASVALRAQQEEVARRHLDAMERWYRSTDCPSLIQHCDRVARRWSKNQMRRDGEPRLPSMSFLVNASTKLTSSVVWESHEALLTQLVRGAMATEGILLLTSPEGLPLMVKGREGELPEGLQEWAEGRIRAALAYNTETEDADDTDADADTICFEDKTWRLSLLISDAGEADTVVGAVALCDGLAQIPLDVLRSLAEHLRGDPKRGIPSAWA